MPHRMLHYPADLYLARHTSRWCSRRGPAPHSPASSRRLSSRMAPC